MLGHKLYFNEEHNIIKDEKFPCNELLHVIWKNDSTEDLQREEHMLISQDFATYVYWDLLGFWVIRTVKWQINLRFNACKPVSYKQMNMFMLLDNFTEKNPRRQANVRKKNSFWEENTLFRFLYLKWLAHICIGLYV